MESSDDQNHSNQCTESRCIAGDDEKKIVCSKCKREFYLWDSSLKNLKGKTSYDGISVAEDFTLFERSMIQEWTNKVKAKNEKEPSDSKYVWKVRGSPSKGLYMKRIGKRWPLSTD